MSQALKLTIVTPSYEKHFNQFMHMVASLVTYCGDIESVCLIAVVERQNEDMFRAGLASFPQLRSAVLFTEDVLEDFGVESGPAEFLKRIGKFTFQSLKKLGALARATTAWSLVLDSEGLFQRPFRAFELLDDYAQRKYVFYSSTRDRGDPWKASTGFAVTESCGAALNMPAGDRWYMEYFHWFYETEKVVDLLENRLTTSFWRSIDASATRPIDYFENILYYLYIERYHSEEYQLLDFEEQLQRFLPNRLSSRYRLGDLPFALFGNEYLLNVLAPDDISDIQPLFDHFRLPFVRLEPPFFSTEYIPALKRLPTFVATISSHHAVWLKKRVAVCISGEFRHGVHRVPEHQLRHLQGFLSGVECDVYVHSWSTPDEALIRHVLSPRAAVFEERPDFSILAKGIKHVEPRIKPGRDEGSLAMFHGLREVYRLVEPHLDEYDYVLRIRPDLYSELSLKEIMVKISDEGDLLERTIYVPRHFHSKGINDQLALGPVDQMATYFDTLSYIESHIDSIVFNPEAVLLKHLLEGGVRLATLEAPYSLMRKEPFKIGSIRDTFFAQLGVWWSRTDDLPQFSDVTEYFLDKSAAVDTALKGGVPEVAYLLAADEDGGSVMLRAEMVDNDPARHVTAMFDRFGFQVASPFMIEDGRVAQAAEVGSRSFFLLADGEGSFTLAEWGWRAGRFGSQHLKVSVDAVRAVTVLDRERRPPGRREAPPELQPAMSPAIIGRLGPFEELTVGQRLDSENGVFRLRLRENGAFVLQETQPSGEVVVVWAEGREGATAALLRMQGDGNLVMYSPEGNPVWASNTDGHPGAYLTLDRTGDVAVRSETAVLWQARPLS